MHPLAWHGLDVAASFLTLCEAWPEQAGRIRADFEETGEDPVRGIAALVALHDIGKFAWTFQAKAPEVFPACLGPWEQPVAVNHAAAGYGLAESDLVISERVQTILGPANDLPRAAILRPIFAHHGRPLEPSNENALICHMARNLRGRRVTAPREAARAFVDAIVELFGEPRLPPMRRGCGAALSWRLAGLVALADWLGSNQTYFAYEGLEPTPESYLRDIAAPRARTALRASGLEPALPSIGDSVAIIGGADFVPTPAQRWAANAPLDDAGLFILEDVMGSGKTEAALILAHRLMQAGRAGGVYLALPTMATADALYQRVAKAYRGLFKPETRPSLVLAHGARNLNPDFVRSIDFADAPENQFAAITEDNEDETASAACACWLSDDRRKTFLAEVGVGTIDQALLAVLPVKHACMRQIGLSRHVLIVDEAHAYDAYMQREIEALIEFQGRLAAPVVILSATLPRFIRRRLIAAYCKGRGVAPPAATGAAYPLATAVGATNAETPLGVRQGLAREIAVSRCARPEEAIARVAAAARGGAAVAYIRNSVDEAITAFRELSAAGIEAELFHARFAMGDRLAIERRAVARFGKDGTPDQRRGRALVATQVAEQSLDLDFDFMATDLAPIDLILQRAGRLWRHNREGRGWPRPELLIVSPSPTLDASRSWYGETFPKAQWVYRDHGLLWLSARELFARDVIRTPDDLRLLVEAVYAERDRDCAPSALRTSGNEAEGRAKAARGAAGLNVLDLDKGYSLASGPWGPDTVTPTRLGEERVIFRLARFVDGALTPWIADADRRRAWALSEVSVRKTRFSARLDLPHAIEEQAERFDAEWARNGTPAICAPLMLEGGRWKLDHESGGKATVQAFYCRDLGLRWE
jgi:CRISPR-associated endonuclease/helicase Cas3